LAWSSGVDATNEAAEGQQKPEMDLAMTDLGVDEKHKATSNCVSQDFVNVGGNQWSVVDFGGTLLSGHITVSTTTISGSFGSWGQSTWVHKEKGAWVEQIPKGAPVQAPKVWTFFTADPIRALEVQTRGTTGSDGRIKVCATIKHTEAPTGAPTDVPTQATATAIGDPHLVNTRGEHFSIFESGTVEFIRVPYELTTDEAEFTLHANIQSFGEGDKCKEAHYITGLLFDGSWFEGKPLKVNVDGAHPGATKKEMKVSFGGAPVLPSTEPIDLGNGLFLHMHNNTNMALNVAGANFAADLQWYFLNVELSSVPKLAEKIGGLLGEDDHSAVSKKPLGCDRQLLGDATPTVYSVARVVA
jgi:hypothetical protein